MTHDPASAESALIALSSAAPDAPARAAARLCLLDWLGCILAARGAPQARALAAALGVEGGDLLGMAFAPLRSDAQTAALALGALGNVLEMDDLHRASILHPGDTICAAALALGLRRKTPGAGLLDALVAGYEIATRIGRVAASGGYTPFYNSGTCGVFGATLSAARLRGLDAEATADALGQAGMQAAGIWQCRLEPSFSKQLATAHAARAGVFSAELGAAGFRGPRAILTGRMGFFASHYPGADPAPLTAPGPWAITEMSYKPFPACRHTHPAISAALALREDGVTEAAEIRVATYGAAIDFCDAPEPRSGDAARFSLQHAVAVTLLRGRPGVADFEGAALTDPGIAALRARVRLEQDPAHDAAFPEAYGARVTVARSSGPERSAECPAAWGDPENPMSEADLLEKFHLNAAHGRVPPPAARALAEAVTALPEAPDLLALHRALTRAVTPEPEPVP
ncbi:MmgE/PrpD family protein [Roseivivax sp. GX 12232]|uniref:MmgE/PrpD family protein n=1 Tax=Roseivivax sp. GX 12232 TaxID=2900547 RepID=UPI001E46F9FE|nr:MmgE/PrpD family protein [Roseivivax sp. GX 12232]MCE0506145.1 MmgE/PrpD family protein [Roseivivax sp. GX 12232]